MEYLDKRIAKMVNKSNKKEKIKKTWEEQLAEIIKTIPKSSINLGNEDFELKELLLFDDRFSIYVPKKFTEMPLEHIKQKYIHELKPQLVYENEKRTINIGFFVIEEKIEQSQIIEIRNIMKNSFIKLNPSSKIFDDGEFTICENKIAYYSFDSAALDGQIFNLVFITSLDEKMLVCNLNCLKKDMEKMKPLFYGIMKTTKIKNIILKEKEEVLEKQIDEQLEPIQLVFDQKQLLNLPTIATLSIRDYNIFICKNENGDTPLNNMYALNNEGEFIWSINLVEDGINKPLPNKNPFIGIEKRGEFALLGLDEEESLAEIGYYIGVSTGKVLYSMNMEKLRSDDKRTRGEGNI